MASLMITGSRLDTRHGHTRMFTPGAVISGTGALMTSLGQACRSCCSAGRCRRGVGPTLIFPAILSISTTMFTGAERTKALAMILVVLSARKIDVPEDVRKRIAECDDPYRRET